MYYFLYLNINDLFLKKLMETAYMFRKNFIFAIHR